jgi:hypothetical protein
VVGVVVDDLFRQVVQTVPLWIAVVLGFRQSGLTKWAALPCLIFWFVIVGAIWLYVLGLARFVHGSYSTPEIAMTIVVGLAGITGIGRALGVTSEVPTMHALGVFIGNAGLQLLVFQMSAWPAMGHHRR